MKKLLACILALVLAICPMIVNASALDTMHDVSVYYHAGSKASEVVSVDISWGAMEFSYHDEVEGTWNPTTHSFVGAVPAYWVVENSSNYVTITNHSNKAVSAFLTLNMSQGYSTVTGQFDNPTMLIPSAVGTASNEPPSLTARLTLSGGIDLDALDQETKDTAAELNGMHIVGTILVTLGS